MTLRDRFDAKWRLDPATGCWLWTAKTGGSGYGELWVTDESGGHLEVASRVSYRLHRGQIPNGLCVLHTCDTPACVNPGHLFLGTQADNLADMVAKGRSVKGEQHGGAKLSDAAVREILSLRGSLRLREVAEQFGVSISLISMIWRGERRALASS